MISDALSQPALDQLFFKARTYNAFTGQIDDDLLHRLYALTRLGPTAANSGPARFVFVRSPEAKAKLEPALSEGNRAKTMSAPVTVIVGYDMRFYDKLPMLFPHTDARSWFAGNPEQALYTAALGNSSLQAAYLIMAARALGLDTGPMQGFDSAMVDTAFFPGTAIRSHYLINLGHGDPASIFPRLPRLPFDEACRIA